MTSRYQSLKKYKGIRKDLKTNKYVAAKSYLGARYSKSFLHLRDAILWQKTFVPDEIKPEGNKLKADVSSGEKSFGHVLERYMKEYLPTLGTSTKQNRQLALPFFNELRDIKLSEFTPEVVSNHILKKKKEMEGDLHHRRFNFDHEIKILKSICNWYAEEDYTFRNPVLKRHFKMGKMRELVVKRKKMTKGELLSFLNSLKENPFWYAFALTHFFCAGRVQEIAGLQIESLDFQGSKLVIKDVAIWCKRTKHFLELKEIPKNGEIRHVFLNEELKRVLLKIIGERKSGFVFCHPNGEPLKYREIQYNYNKALKRADLDSEFSGTHFLRHSMATITRQATGSLEATQAVTGHKDQKLVQHYAALDMSLNKNALEKVSEFLAFPN